MPQLESELLESGSTRLIILEVMFFEHFEGQALLHELTAFLADYREIDDEKSLQQFR